MQHFKNSLKKQLPWSPENLDKPSFLYLPIILNPEYQIYFWEAFCTPKAKTRLGQNKWQFRLPPPPKKVNKQTKNKKKVNAVFWHSRSFILHLCSSLSSVQMIVIVTLPVTFFFLNNSYNPGKTKLSGRGLGGNFKSLRFNFEEGPCRQEEKNFSMAK